ncbi:MULTISPECIES: D-ribose pyranase [unclassified Psychrobacillus]|uniref:D-ribose pyranase n=1 Tax=unclassified Psychrobacillus TaxID=2636677 RepID=UPI001469AC9D|nr:D-ribose pyranase [Psychrobacillus sp. BL-248-WT-3]NME06702.1 D-ribose pyranase [Psychrobacillus sp. BL-248-WT-3]
MKKHGILNRDLAGIFAKLGHTDQITISDCGLPIPDGVTCIDLSYILGKPSFDEILAVVLDDLVVEKAYVAAEMKTANAKMHYVVNKSIEQISEVSHEEFKAMTRQSKVIIRTGEASPYANIILQAGVIF